MSTPVLEIRLLGELELRRDGEAIPSPESAKAQSLLAYLVLNGLHPQSRHRLAFLLWPDSTEAQALTNLRHQLHNLRRSLPDSDGYLEVSKRSLRWHPTIPYWVDVGAFEAAGSVPEGSSEEVAELERAVALYRGDLLPGNQDEWLAEYRQRLRDRYLEAVERLAAALESLGQTTRAIRYLEHLVRHDPLREDDYRRLIRMHASRGDRARALAAYHQCASVLQSELGVDPAAETKQLYAELLAPPAAASLSPERSAPPASRALIGRSAEWAALRAVWDDIVSGERRMALVTGEPGIGKTRLVEEFRDWCASSGATTAEGRSYALEAALLYGPVVEWLRSDSFGRRVTGLSDALKAELARLLPELRPDTPPETAPERSPHLLFEALLKVFTPEAKPALLVADDLQWADRPTLQFLHYLVRAPAPGRVLVLGTARREELERGHPLRELITSLGSSDALVEVELERLSATQTISLASHLAGRSLGEEEGRALFDRTEGNPLFVVEEVRAGLSSFRAPSPSISPKVQSVIEFRINQLSDQARELVEIAATIGRVFTVQGLATASGYEDEDLVRALDELWRRRIVRERGAEEYDFSHDRIREVVYEGVSSVKRRHLHLRVARALEQVPDHAAREPSRLAFHYEHAGRWEEAAEWYRRAAVEAQLAHALDEALALLERGLKTVRAGGLDTEKARRAELSLLLAQLAPLSVLEGSVSARLISVQRRAWELTHLLGEKPASPLVRSLAVTDLSMSRFDAAVGMGRLLAEQAEATGEEVSRVESDYVLGIAGFWSGDFLSARRHFESAVRGYRSEHAILHRLAYGLDPKVVCLSRLANTLWFLGRPLAAVHARDEALALGGEIGHRSSIEIAQVFAALLALELRDLESFRSFSSAILATGERQRMPATELMARAARGYLEVLEGNAAAGFEQLEAALEEGARFPHAPGASFSLTRMLLEAYRCSGKAEAGAEAAARAINSGAGLYLFEPETRRIRAELLERVDPASEEIEEELRTALEVARRQHSVSMLARAAATLVEYRLKHRPGGVQDARQLLESALAQVPPGEMTPELRDAAALLAP